MPKKRKYPRLPNGFGQIRYLGKGRTLPYAVHPPATDRNERGEYIRPKALCYVPDWYTAFAVLSAYHAGTYRPGMELELTYDRADVDGFCRKIMMHAAYQDRSGSSFESVYKAFYEYKFGDAALKKLSESSQKAYKLGWSYLKELGHRPINSISVDDMQRIVNTCEHGTMTKGQIVMTAKSIFRYAMQRDLCEKDPSQYLVVPDGEAVEHGRPFTDDEIVTLWQHRDDKHARTLLMMIYSGWRIGELQTLEINLDEDYFRGGIKTKAGRDRIVPIHSGVRGLTVLATKFPAPNSLRAGLTKYMRGLNMDHTPHDCRHTFSALCERYDVREADRKRMLGHSFGNDTTNAVYGHRTVDELRTEIEKIIIPKCGVL